jgi:hypothetical protein
MNDTLTEILAQLNLQPGQCQLVQVNGYHVEIRRPAEEPSDFADMVMLQPWVDFPDSEAACQVLAHYAPHPLPDPPVIPADQDEAP